MVFESLITQLNLEVILSVIVTLVLSVLIYLVLSKILVTAATRVHVPREKVDVINNVFKIAIGGVAFISILGAFHIDVTGLIAGVSIVALAVGFAAQTIISNLISGLFLIFERVFTIGDIVQIGEATGRVVKTSFRTTQIETIDGNVVTFPNSMLMSSQLTNMTSGENAMNVILEEEVDIYADYQTAKTLMLEAATTTPGVIVNESHQPFVLTKVVASEWRIALQLFVTVRVVDWYVVQSNLQETIKRRFDTHKILPPITPIARSRMRDIASDIERLESEN